MNAAAEGWEGSRRLLQRVRSITASTLGARERLDGLTAAIAEGMSAGVCSIYVRHGENRLVLGATRGLRAEAVHVTELLAGEGLVGLVAAEATPLALADAAAHENFAHRPETGEDAYRSFLGVPLLRAGRVAGVLAVQDARERVYTEAEVETLETVAMVVAEIVVGQHSPEDGPEDDAAPPVRLEGRILNTGLGLGSAFLHEAPLPAVAMVSDDEEGELRRVDEALERMHRALDDRFRAEDLAGEGEHREVLNAYRRFAEDQGWLRRIREAVRGGLSAEGAVTRIQEQMRARLRQAHDAFFRERLHDLDDLGNRLLHHLSEERGGYLREEPPPDAVVIARSMGPAELLDYPPGNLRAVLLEEGSPTAHVAIIARALDVPVLGGLETLPDHVEAGDRIAVDADNGQVFVRPTGRVVDEFVASMNARAERRKRFAALRDLPAVTRDGEEVEVHVNAGLLVDIGQAEEVGAAGVGLYRTEIPFMVRSRFPDTEDQERLYRRAIDLSEGRPLCFRTLDIGGDKVLPYWRLGEEANPALGWRAIRLTLDRPFMLHQQLRAMIRAAAGRELRVMFPMVAEVAEFDRAREILDSELNRERNRGRPIPDPVLVGAMLEVPALVWQLPALMGRVDFLTVGSNDLLQFLFAADRDNPRMAERYDVLSPAVLALAAHVADAARGRGCRLAFCGEMASRPLEALALLGLGFRVLSVSPSAVGPLKAMVRSVEMAPLAGYVRSLTDLPDRSVREKLRLWALDHAIDFDPDEAPDV